MGNDLAQALHPERQDAAPAMVLSQRLVPFGISLAACAGAVGPLASQGWFEADARMLYAYVSVSWPNAVPMLLYVLPLLLAATAAAWRMPAVVGTALAAIGLGGFVVAAVSIIEAVAHIQVFASVCGNAGGYGGDIIRIGSGGWISLAAYATALGWAWRVARQSPLRAPEAAAWAPCSRRRSDT